MRASRARGFWLARSIPQVIALWQRLWQYMRRRQIRRLRPGQTREELLALIARAPAIGSEEERQSLQRFVNFHELRIREIMTPRSDIISIDVQASMQDACQRMVESQIVRMPVVDGGLDHILGMVHIRTLFAHLVRGEYPPLRDLLSEPIWVSELEKVGSLLTRMRSQSHVAIAQDEFGGTAGLVTLSDLLEEIFGNMNAFDDVERGGTQAVVRASDVIPARTRIEDLEEPLRQVLQGIEGDFDTLGGLLITCVGYIPQTGEEIEVAGLRFVIERATPRRIESVRVLRAGY